MGNNITPSTGRFIGENGEVVNIADMIAKEYGVQPIAGIKFNIENYTPASGRILGDNGNVYNIIDLITAIIAGGGSGGTGGTTNHAALMNLAYATSGHTGFASIEHINEHKDLIGELQEAQAALKLLGSRIPIIADDGDDLKNNFDHVDTLPAGFAQSNNFVIASDGTVWDILSIDGDGFITWHKFIEFATDISGKQDKLTTYQMELFDTGVRTTVQNLTPAQQHQVARNIGVPYVYTTVNSSINNIGHSEEPPSLLNLIHSIRTNAPSQISMILNRIGAVPDSPIQSDDPADHRYTLILSPHTVAGGNHDVTLIHSSGRIFTRKFNYQASFSSTRWITDWAEVGKQTEIPGDEIILIVDTNQESSFSRKVHGREIRFEKNGYKTPNVIYTNIMPDSNWLGETSAGTFTAMGGLGFTEAPLQILVTQARGSSAWENTPTYVEKMDFMMANVRRVLPLTRIWYELSPQDIYFIDHRIQDGGAGVNSEPHIWYQQTQRQNSQAFRIIRINGNWNTWEFVPTGFTPTAVISTIGAFDVCFDINDNIVEHPTQAFIGSERPGGFINRVWRRFGGQRALAFVPESEFASFGHTLEESHSINKMISQAKSEGSEPSVAIIYKVEGEERYNHVEIMGISANEWLTSFAEKSEKNVITAIDSTHPLYEKLKTTGNFEPVMRRNQLVDIIDLPPAHEEIPIKDQISVYKRDIEIANTQILRGLESAIINAGIKIDGATMGLIESRNELEKNVVQLEKQAQEVKRGDKV